MTRAFTVTHVNSNDIETNSIHQAVEFDIAEGNLLLFSTDNVLIAAYAPGVWRSVS